ncbi:MAG: Ig-like domain-containing protein, partial [Propionibacteriaceae bacterium]|nr:Ig-like domain-containing protein [Propionibacteriaceae bacterium]
MTSAPSTRFRHVLQRVGKPVAWLSALALAVGGVTVAQQFQGADEAEALYPPTSGTGDKKLSVGVTWSTNAVYVAVSASDRVARFTTNSDGLITSNALTTVATMGRAWTGAGTAANGAESMALDGGEFTGTPMAYFWGWNAYEGDIYGGSAPATSGDIQVQAFPNGAVNSYAFRILQPSGTGSGGTYDYWSGGEVIQRTGEIFFSGGECNRINGSYRMMIVDPGTKAYRASGLLSPASASDHLWGSSTGNTCTDTALGRVASDMALDGYGNAYILVQGQAAAGSQWAPNGVSVRHIYLVRVVPGANLSGWKYNIVQVLQAAPGASSDVYAWTGTATGASNMDFVFGMAFLNGHLYATRGTGLTPSTADLMRIDPLSGLVYHVPENSIADVSPAPYDLASGQTAYVTAGQVFNDVNANGVREADEPGLANQIITLYKENAAGAWVWLGTRQTSGTGDYSFIVSGQGTYHVRLVQPKIGGVNAVQTYASSGESPPSSRGLNTVSAQCYDYGTETVVPLTASGVCRGALPVPYSDAGSAGSLGGILSALDQVAIHSTMVLTNAYDIPAADFGVTALGSFGDAGTGPATVAAAAPVHVTGLTPSIFLGSVQGSYTAPATDNAAHNASDDGVYMQAYNGARIPLNQVGVLAAQRTYDNLKAQVSGDLAGSADAQVQGWITSPVASGNGAWAAAPSWTPTISSGVASGGFIPSTVNTLLATPQYVNMRVAVSTQATTVPTNASNQYQSTGGSPWVTNGEIEDYRYQVADAAYRVAAQSNGGTGTFTVDGQSLTTVASATVYGVGSGLAAGSAKTVTVTLPNASWQVDHVEVRDTSDGALVASPVYNENTATSGTFSFTPALSQDLTALVVFTKAPDPVKSELSLSAATATVGADITATATVKTAEDVLLPNVTVRFQAATDLVVHAGQSSQPVSQCTTNIDGVCSVLVTSSVAASYSNGLVAQVWTDNAWRDLTGSPASLAFTADAGRPGSSQLVVSPAGPLVVGSSSANTYALTTTIRDGSNNLVPGAEVTFSVDGVDGSPIDAGLGGLSALTAQTGSDGVASVTFTSTKPGSFRLHAQIPNPEAGNVLTDVGGSDPTLSSPQVRVFNPAPTRGDVSAFVVAPLNNLLGETAVATVTLKDGYENAIPGRSQASLNIATGCSVASDFAEIGNGVYTFNLTVTGTVACEDTVTVTPDVGVTLQQTVRWAVPQPTETYSDLVLSHSSQTVGQNVVATVTVRDQHDRPITGLTAAQVVLSSDPTDVTITGFRALTAAGDEGKYEWDLTSTVSGLKTITAVVSGVTFNAAVRQVTFTADVPTELNSSFRITPASLQVQGVALASLVVRDQYGNGVPDVAPTLNYGALTRLSGPTAGTGPGTGLYTWFLTTSTAGDYTVTATVPVPGDDDIVLTDTVSFVAGDITGLDFDYSPASVPVSDSAGATMVGAGQVFDDQNNAVRGLTLDDFELTYRQVADPDDSTTWVASTDVQVVPGSFAEDASGNYSFDVYSQVAGSYEVTVAVHGVEQLLDYLVTFTAETPDQDGASLSITPDPSYVGTEAQMALTVTDRFDNPVPGLASGLTVAPSSDYSPVGAWVEQFDQYGASTGVYHRGLTSDSSGTHTVSVTVPASPSALTVTDDITFQYAMGGTVTLSFNAGPHYVSEQAGATAVATVNVLDANNQPITNLLDADFDFDFDADVHLVPGSFANLSNGNYSYSLYSTVADTYDIEVGLDLVGSDSESLTFLPTEPDDTNTSFVIDPATQVPGSSVTGTVTVKDAFGNPISGLTAAGFDLDADGLTVVSGPTADAGTPGDYTYVFSSNVTNVYDPTVTVGQVTKTAQVEYLFGSVDPAFSDVTVNPAQQVVDQTVGITVTVRDSSPGHNLINNLTQADFEITAASQTAGAPDRGASFVSNNNDGTYTFSVTSQLIGQFAVQATVLGSLLDDHPVITFTASGVCVNNCHPIDPTHRTRVEMTANDQLSDGSHQDKAVLYAYDTNGNPVKDAQVVAQAAAGNTNLTPQTNNATTGPDGTAELAWTSLVQGTYTATVTADGLTPAVGGVLSQIRFSQTQPASTVLTVTPSGPLTVGGTYTAEVQVRDAQSTPLEGINISFSALVSSSGEPNPSASLSEQTCQTGLNGRCSITVTSQIAGVYNVNATVPIDGVATPATDSPTPITFNPGPVCVQDCQPVDPTRVTRVEVTKNGQPPSGVDEATLHAHDTYGNAVSGATVTTSTTDSGLTVLTPNVQTAADGSAVLQYTSVVAGAHPAQVRVDSQTPNGSPVSLVFVSNPGDPGQSFLTATPAGPLAAGGMYTITATVLDSTGLNRVNGIPISFTGQSGLTFVNGVDSCETAGSGATAGTCSVLVTSRLAGSYQVGATMPDSGGVTQSLNNSPIEVEFVASTICITGCDPIDPTHYSHVEIIKNGADFNGVDHDIVRVFAYDYSGNPVSGAAVSAATTDADLTVQPTIDSTGPDGVSTVWFASTVAGPHDATVTVGGLPAGGWPVTLAFGEGKGDPDHSSFAIVPDGPLVVGDGAANTYTVTATVNDIFDSPVTGAVVAFTVTPAVADGPVFGGGQDTCTTVSGTCQVTLSSTKSGTYAIGAELSSGAIGTAQTRAWQADEVCAQSAGCTPVDPTSPRTRVEVEIDNQLADGSTPDIALLYAYDKWGNPVPSVLVESATTDSALTILPGTEGTNEQGQSRIRYTSTVAGAHEATVTVQGKTPNGSPITLNFKPGPISPDTTSWAIDPVTQVPGNTVTGTLTVKDELGNPVDGIPAGDISLVPDGLTVVSGPTAQGDGQYTYVFNATAADTYDPEVTVRGVVKTASVTYGYGEIDASASTVVISPTEQRAGQNIQVIITVKDVSASHNPIPDLAPSAFTVTATSQTAGAPDLTGSFVSNNNDGTYTFNISSRLVGQFAVQATVQSVLLANHPVASFIAGGVCVTNCTPVDPTHVTRLEMIQNDQLSDGSSPDKARAYAYDTYGNAVNLAQVRAQAAAGNAALTPQINQAQTGPDGTAELAWTSLTPGVYTATATIDGLEPATGVLSAIRFNQTQPDPDQSTLTVTPDSPITVGNSYTARVEVRDAQGTPLAGVTASFSALVSSSSEPNPVASLSQQTCYTGLNGTCSITVTSQIAGVYAVTATVPVQGQATNVQNSPAQVAFTPGPVCVSNCQNVDPTRHTRVEVTRNGQPPNGVDEAMVYAHDTYGNAVSDVVVTTSTTDPTLTVQTPNVQTGPNGSAVLRFTSAVAGAHPAQVTVASQAITGSPVTLNFVEGDVDPSQSFLTVTPTGSLAAGGLYTVTATVLDSTGLNRVNGVPISFSGQSDLTFVNGLSTCTTAGVGSTAGTCSVQVSSKVAASYQVGATMPDTSGVSRPLSNSPVTVSFIAGPICVTNCTPIDPADVTRAEVITNGAAFDGNDHDVVRVYAYDTYGNPVSDAAVASTTSDADLFIQPAGTIQPTGANGTVTVWYASTVAGDHSANVTVGGLTPNGSPVTLGFGSGTGDPSRSSYTIAPAGPLVVGTEAVNTYTITATVNDVFGAPVIGEVVTFKVDPAGPVFGGNLNSCTTAAGGTCQVTLSSTKSGTYSITANLKAGPIGTGQSRAWQADEVCAQSAGCIPVDPNSPRTRVEVTLDDQPADGSTPDKAILYAYDKWGNPVPGALVESVTTDSDLTIQPSIPGTNDQGQSEILYTSTVAGAHQATLTVQGKTPTGSPITLNFKPDQISAANTTWVIEPSNQIPGNPVTGTLTVQDAQHNPIDGIPAGEINLIPGGLTVVSGPTAQSDGQYVYELTATQTNTYDTELTVRGVTKTASVTYGYAPIDANASTVAINPAEQTAGQNIQVIVTVKDSSASHNPIPNLDPSAFTVTATSQTPGAPDLTGSFVSNNNDGTYTF